MSVPERHKNGCRPMSAGVVMCPRVSSRREQGVGKGSGCTCCYLRDHLGSWASRYTANGAVNTLGAWSISPCHLGGQLW
jgi:hypothetical protein